MTLTETLARAARLEEENKKQPAKYVRPLERANAQPDQLGVFAWLKNAPYLPINSPVDTALVVYEAILTRYRRYTEGIQSIYHSIPRYTVNIPHLEQGIQRYTKGIRVFSLTYTGFQ